MRDPLRSTACSGSRTYVWRHQGAGPGEWELVMARTSSRRHKGCRICKPHKHAGNGDAARIPFRDVRKVGRKRRWNRHDVD